MIFSRRSFLSAAVASAALSTVSGRLAFGASLPRDGGVFLLDTGPRYRESVAGYESALAARRIPFVCGDLVRGHVPASSVVIVPGFITLQRRAAGELSSFAGAGGLLLLESGAGFASAAEFEAHRNFLRDYFNVSSSGVIDLWEGEEGRGRVPYVDYRWPHDAKVRDFSRLVVPAVRDKLVIARIGSHVAASKQHFGRGTLLFLGSPLGPALGFRDTEAGEWLHDAITLS